MENVDKRRSDRVQLELRIQLSGVDAAGRSFKEQTHTLVVSRHGAKVVSRHVLLPQQALSLRCHRTGLEALTNVIGQIGHEANRAYYGLGIPDPKVNIWNIEFPGMNEAEHSAGRVLLECMGCHLQEVAHLDTFALEVLLANQCLVRPCRHCTGRRISVWKQALGKEAALPETAISRLPTPPSGGAKQAHISLKAEVCLRHDQLGDEVAMTETVWCGGFRFQSQRGYGLSSLLSAAMPYTPDKANVFSPVRVVCIEPLSAKGTFAYDVSYVPAEKVLSDDKPPVQGAA